MAGQKAEKQIQTIEALRDIIHSMRSLAATYLSRAEERLGGVRAYADTVEQALNDCLFGREIALPREEGRGSVVLAFFSEQGMCGRFNEVMAEAAVRHAAAVPHARFVVVGRRGPGLLRMAGLDVLAEIPSTTSLEGVDFVMQAAVRTVLEMHSRAVFAQLYLLHAAYLSPGRIEPSFRRILPLDLSSWRHAERARTSPPRLAMPRLELLQGLVDEYAFIALYHGMVESLASENGMRLQSMEAARTNIDEALADLQMRARTERQNEITEELLDVISGAEALR